MISTSAPIFLVKKKDGSLCLVMYCRGLNKVAICNRYALPLIPNLLECLSEAKKITKIDLRGTYNIVCILTRDDQKTALRVIWSFQYTIMLFGLENAPSAFKHMANDTFRHFLDIFSLIYVDDILMQPKTQDEHDIHVRQVLQWLEKCTFDCNQVEFLGYIVSTYGVSMDLTKVQIVLYWQTPYSLCDVQCFLRLENFYQFSLSRIIPQQFAQLSNLHRNMLNTFEQQMPTRHLLI